MTLRRLKASELRGYSGLVKVLSLRRGCIVQVGYLLFRDGRLIEGHLDTGREKADGEHALRLAEEGDFYASFDPPLGGGRDLLQLAIEKGALEKLERYD